jgi:hypothetical protein
MTPRRPVLMSGAIEATPKSGLAPPAQKKAARAITVRLFPQLPAQ